MAARAYSLQDLETLRQAAKAVGTPVVNNAYTLSDLPLLAAAAELLGTSIPELPQALAKLGLSSTTLDPPPGPLNAINLNDDDAVLRASLERPTQLGGLDHNGLDQNDPGQTNLGHDAFDGHGQEATGDINWAEYAGNYGGFPIEDPLDPAFWALDCDQPWLPSTLDTGGLSNDDGGAYTSGPSSLLAGSAASSTGLGVHGNASAAPLMSPDRPSARDTPRTLAIAPGLATGNSIARVTKPQPAARGPILDARIRKDISDARQRKACIRCRMQKLKVYEDLLA